MSDALTSREPDLLVADIIEAELELSPEQVMLANQKIDIRNDGRLYVSVKNVGPGKVIANNNYSDTIDGVFTECQQSVILHMIQIDALAFNKTDGTNEAWSRKEEIIMALRSVKSQQLQDQHNAQIARVPSGFMNASDLEGNNRMLSRYTATVNVTTIFTKTKAGEYYDTFRTELFKTNDLKLELKVDSSPY